MTHLTYDYVKAVSNTLYNPSLNFDLFVIIYYHYSEYLTDDYKEIFCIFLVINNIILMGYKHIFTTVVGSLFILIMIR